MTAEKKPDGTAVQNAMRRIIFKQAFFILFALIIIGGGLIFSFFFKDDGTKKPKDQNQAIETVEPDESANSGKTEDQNGPASDEATTDQADLNGQNSTAEPTGNTGS